MQVCGKAYVTVCWFIIRSHLVSTLLALKMFSAVTIAPNSMAENPNSALLTFFIAQALLRYPSKLAPAICLHHPRKQGQMH
jgi:hypothetical protein